MTGFYRWLAGGLTLVGTLALVGYVGAQAWVHLGPRKPSLSAVRREVAQAVVPQVVEDLRRHRGDLRVVALLHLANDPTDYVTDQLRGALEQSGVVDVLDPSFDEKLERLLRLRVASAGDLEKALGMVRGRGAQGVVFGRVEKFEAEGAGAVIDLELNLARVETGQVVFSRRYTQATGRGLLTSAAVEEGVRRWGGAPRLLAWALIVLLLPVFSIGFIRAMVRKESNRANATVLAIYTVVDGLLACLVVGAGLGGWLAVLGFLGLVGLALAYNVFLMTLALKMET